MEKQLREPENWQDFELLCKKLWGEIWNCLEIKKNGSPGQMQQGVDLFGIPEINTNNDKRYYGIQCKKKDKKKNNKITKTEINTSIEEAVKFKPPLKKYYIATTASKDVEIEEYIREKNLENIKKGLFQIEIFFWEDIVSLIDENKYTHNWYVKNKGYKLNYKIEFAFDDNSKELLLKPIFKKVITDYKLKPKPIQLEVQKKEIFKKIYGIDYDELIKPLQQPSMIKNLQLLYQSSNFNILNPPNNLSRVDFAFVIKNEGNTTLEDYKINLNFEGDFKKIGVCTKGNLISSTGYKYDAKMKNENNAVLSPFNKILVPEDKNEFDTLYLYPNHDCKEVIIEWKFLSRDHNEDGNLIIKIETEYKEEYYSFLVDDEKNVRTIIDYQEYKEDR